MSDFVLDNPFLEYLDARHVAWEDGYAEFRMPIQAKHLNRRGVLQGGAVATLLDAACGYAGVYAPEGEPAIHGFTLSLTVNYLDTGLGESVTAKGFIERRGRSIYFARGEAWVDDKILIASAQGTFKYSGLKKG
ncbi:PaaI family thioesterase [Caballeronia sp. DA-9]|uniref:PaaI family thioesterase n=1 Tax=Caballeronia sp. DA-9 TaxID=3436237 RepID=UPI003F661874